MATVHVLVGQCGNQLGSMFLNNLVCEARASSDDHFSSRVSSLHFRPFQTLHEEKGCAAPPLPRCVMIDMEPKVLQSVIADANGADAYRLHPQQCITRNEGSANNWAFGYHVQGDSRRTEILEALRHESESCGTVDAFHVIHSLAGGTGSGVGCLVADVVREEFPHVVLQHSVVWPFSTGEVVTQWYNCVLAMSSLRDSADAVFIAHNDDFGGTSAAKKSVVEGHTEVSFTSINNDITRLLLDLHLPRMLCRVPHPSDQRINTRSFLSSEKLHPNVFAGAPLRSCGLSDVVESVALDPAMKFFTGFALPCSKVATTTPGITNNGKGSVSWNPCSSSWHSVLRDAARRSAELFHPFNASSCNVQRPSLWSLRGPGVCSEGLGELQDVLSTGSLRVPPTGLMVQEQPLRGHAAHLSLFGPSRNIGVQLSSALEKTEQFLSVGAFTHHFSRYNVAEDDLRNAVLRLWDTAASYAPE